jgi:hypothetical protein
MRITRVVVLVQLPVGNFLGDKKAAGYCGWDSVGGGAVETLYSAASLSKPLMTW